MSISQRRQKLQSKIDRAYDDYLEGRVSEAQWTRKSAEWESELATTDAELSRLTTAAPTDVATGEKILELAKTAHFRYVEQSPAEQRRLLDIVLSNCTFDRGTLCPTYTKPFDLLVRGTKLEIGGEGGIRTRQDSLVSLSCRFHIATIPVDAMDAVASCTRLHQDFFMLWSNFGNSVQVSK